MLEYLTLPIALLGITCLMAMGLQLIVGAAGLLTLGHAAFFAIGGYASAATVVFVLPRVGISPGPLALLAGGLTAAACAATLALLLGSICLRLRGDYLAVATLGLSQITENLLFNWRATGGASGFTDVPVLLGPAGVWGVTCVIALAMWRLQRTPLGQAIVCARDDDIVAQSFGISVGRVRLAAFAIGNAVTGVAGALYVHTFAFISPTAAGFGKSVEILLAVVLGGMYSLRGSLVGATLLVAVPEILRFVPAPLSALLGRLVERGLCPPPLAAGLASLSGNAMVWFAALVLAMLLAGSGLRTTLWRLRSGAASVRP